MKRCIVLFMTGIIISFQVFSIEVKNIIYSTNPQYPPYDWCVGENMFEGASIELFEMAAPPGIKLVPVSYPWKRAFLLAEQGDIDVLLSIRKTPEREKFLEFTTHRAFPNPIVVFARKDRNIQFKEWSDLKKYTGGISLGDTFGGGFDEYWKKELKIEQASNMEENFKKLELGRIDYFVSGYFMGLAYLESHKIENTIVVLEPTISSFDIYFGFSKNSEKKVLIDYISKKLEELDKKGVPEKLLKKYLEKYKQNPKIYNPM